MDSFNYGADQKISGICSSKPMKTIQDHLHPGMTFEEILQFNNAQSKVSSEYVLIYPTIDNILTSSEKKQSLGNFNPMFYTTLLSCPLLRSPLIRKKKDQPTYNLFKYLEKVSDNDSTMEGHRAKRLMGIISDQRSCRARG
jgi:hypothetical protein